MLILVLVFWTGCSLFPQQIKTEFVEAKKFEFVVIDVNVSEVERPPALSLNGKVHFEDDMNESVVMGVDTWIKIRDISSIRTKAIKRLNIHLLMYRKALNAVNGQIRRYLDLEKSD